MTEYLLLIAILLLIGAFAGVLAGLFGVGGGIVLVPAFLFIFTQLGYDNPQIMQICVATSLATIIVTSLRSLRAHYQKGAADLPLLKAWFAPIAIGAVTAVLTARNLRSDVMMVIFAILALIIAFLMFFGAGRKKIADHMPQGFRKWLYGIATGFFSTMMGIGGGSIAVPLMVSHGRSIHQAVGTASGFGAMIALPSTIAFMLTSPPPENLPPFQIGYVNIAAAVIVVIATMITAPFGARLAHKLDAQKLKRLFAIFIVIVALNMLRKTIWG